MKTYMLRCWKYPAFSAEIEVEAESLEHALEIGQEDGRFDYADFEDCTDGDYGAPMFLRATDDETDDERELDLDPGADLLAAAKAALTYLGDDQTDDSPEARDTRAVLRAAIAKAEGGR